MLNASTDNEPRQISIGLPSTIAATIYEDGLPIAFNLWPCLPHKYWAGGVSYPKIALLSISETTLRSGSVGYSVDSYTKEGSDQFNGVLNYTSNHFGLQRFGLNVSGPITNGWSYSFGSFQNFDPGTNDLGVTPIQYRTQIYKAGLTKVWNEGKGKASLFYKYSSYKGVADNNGPFYYNGDGSVTLLDGFNLGKDSYFPTSDNITYMNVQTGEIESQRFSKGNKDYGNDLNFNLNYDFGNDLLLVVRSKYKYGRTHMLNSAIAGIDKVETADRYTYADGTPYEGNIQQRFNLIDIGFERDWLTNAELTGNKGNHSWRIGLNEFYNRAGIYASSSLMAHEVKKDPQWLLLNGHPSWVYNNGAEFYDGHENRLSLYLSDDWQITNRLWLSAGVRMEYYTIGGKSAMNIDGKTNNTRTENFNLKQEGVEITRFSNKWFNPAFTFNGRYTILQGFGLVGEYNYNRNRPILGDYSGSSVPIFDPVYIEMASGGIFYNNPWIQLVSQFSYISQTKFKTRSQFTKQIQENSETVTEPVTYDIATMGWTTDVVLTPFKGFSFHGLLTLQDPLYKNFVLNPKFSDGSQETYDFRDKNVTGMSKIIIELDPSYTFDKWRLWASFRYQGKQYLNKTNSLYLNGRWETFAGVDYQVNKHLSLSTNVVNILNEKGASGSISSADLVVDASSYRNYLMAGNYIRPFTVEFAARINF
ncbi:MAG: TonB-dependent receptor [Tannerellaceae bacterium]|nr:TonB-dependent receptor [Tannerellaceae bacterium]